MSLYFLKSGILTTIQDLGRSGFRRFGINPSGAMDRMACRLANIILGNDETEPVLEIHFPAPILKFEKTTNFAICGADFSAQLNDRKVETFRPLSAKEGDILIFAEPRFGTRVYLAVEGGFQTEKWLGSASTNLKIGFGHNLQKGERIHFKRQTSRNSRNAYKVGFGLIPRYSHFPTVRVLAGAEFDQLTAISVETFLKNSFKISATSDRMGFRLEGNPLFLLEEVEMVSTAVDFGTIQLLPNGQMVILMADHQTTGGYPRIAHVTKIDLPIVAQLKPGDKIYFKMISEEEAEKLFLMQNKNLNLLKWAVKFK